nr:MAG: ORF1 [TTV-like mini virus]
MPYYWRPWYRRRRRRLWRRRARKAIRRRFWRRRHHWVRKPKRKAKKITVKQWQPSTIKRLKVRGPYPLFQGTTQRLGNNMTQYLDSIAPHLIPGGGLMSITQFSLNCLYELHKKARNWWTQSNCHLPLIRYSGCKIKLFRSTNVDYVFVYATCGDMKASEKMYQSTQPGVLLMNKRKVIVRCLENTKHKRPFKTVKIQPPAMLQNKWYFQQELANIPLLLTITSACSLDRFYTAANSISNTIGFESLNTDFFQNHNFKTPYPTTGYKPNNDFSLYTFKDHTTFEEATYKHLVYLGNSKEYTHGYKVDEVRAQNTQTWEQKCDVYFTTMAYWGNPFTQPYFDEDYDQLIVTKKTLQEVQRQAKITQGSKKLTDDGFFTKLTQPLTWHCRYNPQQDQSHNAVFFSPITGNPIPWEQPHDARLTTEGLPLWLLFQGLLDYHAKAQDIQRLTTDYITAIVSDYISPKKSYYVPLDKDFLENRSPYETQDGYKTTYDIQNWQPKTNFQLQSINTILSTGPATSKLPEKISAEAHMLYTFYFKLGGCPPPMDDVCDPAKQPTFPTPGNLLSTTILQSPETPIEYYLSSFDQRRDILTSTAAKRLKTDWTIKDPVFQPTGTTAAEVPIRTTEETSTEDSSEEEKDQETLQWNLQQHRRKQRKLRKRILQLLALTQNLE